MIIRFSNTADGEDVELELIRNGDVQVRIGGAHTATGKWSKDDNDLEIDVPARTMVQGFIGKAEEDVSTEDVLVFRLK
jgi:hypothetical protein